MAKLLHIQTSPRGDRWASQAVAERLIDSYRNAHRGDTIETLNVWQARSLSHSPELPMWSFGVPYKLKHSMSTTRASDAAKAVVRRNIEEVQGKGRFDVFEDQSADDSNWES
jgi:FMN-dependent NADH-azoreductase